MRRRPHHNLPHPRLGRQRASIGAGTNAFSGHVSGRRGHTSAIRRRRFPSGMYYGKAPKPRW